MKLFTAFAALTLASTALVGCQSELPASIPYNSQTAIKDWAGTGDRLVKAGRYSDAYQAYMSRCNDSSGSSNMRMAGCGAARDFRLEAKRLGVDTSAW